MKDCPFASNEFCRSVARALAEAPCAHCHLKTYEEGTHLDGAHWNKGAAVVVDGLALKGEVQPESGKFLSIALAAPGAVVSSGPTDFFSRCPRPDHQIVMLRRSTVALFDTAWVQAELAANLDFYKAFTQACMHFCGVEANEMLHEIGSKDAYHAVRYVVKYCRDHRIPQLTHEKIALACNRNRTTVTEAMHRIAVQEPELLEEPRA